VSVPVFILFGPTASGKTALLERLFTGPGRLRGAQVVSADSMQVYRGMDIGTAKPPPELCAALPHHLIDLHNPDEQYNAGEFAGLAAQACRDIWEQGCLPVVSGGAGFYLRNFILGMPEAPPSDAGIRESLKAEFDENGVEPLLAELRAGDSVSAQRIHPNDTYRLLRALEVLRLTGRPLSAFARNSFSPKDAGQPAFNMIVAGIDRDRAELYSRIDRRCRDMFKAGLASEVRGLYEGGFTPDCPGLKAIGYREFFIRADGAWRFNEDTDAVMALVAQNSRRYAKRQVVEFRQSRNSWFKASPDVHWLHLSDVDDDSEARAAQTIGGLIRGL
jgi:tRNA dimethylallyltransferase